MYQLKKFFQLAKYTFTSHQYNCPSKHLWNIKSPTKVLCILQSSCKITFFLFSSAQKWRTYGKKDFGRLKTPSWPLPKSILWAERGSVASLALLGMPNKTKQGLRRYFTKWPPDGSLQMATIVICLIGLFQVVVSAPIPEVQWNSKTSERSALINDLEATRRPFIKNFSTASTR